VETAHDASGDEHAKRVANPRTGALLIASSLNTTGKFTIGIRVPLLASTAQKSRARFATTFGFDPGSEPRVANFRKPAVLNGAPPDVVPWLAEPVPSFRSPWSARGGASPRWPRWAAATVGSDRFQDPFRERR
jgi:hypothetical protein